MARWNSDFFPHSAHSGEVQKHFGSEQSGHLKMAKSAYPSFMVMPLFSSSLCFEAHWPVSAWTRVVLPWST
jgi:hypothetical protein